MEADDPVNAIGTVRRQGQELEVVVTRAEDLVRAADLPSPAASPIGDGGATDLENRHGTARLAGLADPPVTLGIGGLVAAASATLLVVGARRRRSLLLAARVRARLEREVPRPEARRAAAPPR
jgi:hypothetical protein